MRTRRLPKRAGRRVPRGTIWVLVAYAAIAAVLTIGMGLPLPWGLLGAGGLLALVWVNTHPDDRHSGGTDAGAQYHGGGGGVSDFGGGLGSGGGGDGGGG